MHATLSRAARPPITFARHVTAVPIGAAIGATLYAAWAVVDAIFAGRLGAMLALTPVLWIAAFIAALLCCAFWLTLLWPVTRRRGSLAGIVATLGSATGAVALTGFSAAAVARATTPESLAYCAGLGAITGLAYWMIVRR